MLIYFCATCGATVPEQAIKSGMAVQSAVDKVFCFKCVSTGVAKVSESAVQRALLAKKTEGGFRQRITRMSQRLLAQVPDNRFGRAVKRISKRYFSPKTGTYKPVVGSSPRNRIDPYTKLTLNNAKEKRAEANNMALIASICGAVAFALIIALVVSAKKPPVTTASKETPPALQAPSTTSAPSVPIPAPGAEKGQTGAAQPTQVTPTGAPANPNVAAPNQAIPGLGALSGSGPGNATLANSTPRTTTPVSIASAPAVGGPAPMVIPPLLFERDSGPVSTTDFKNQISEDRLNEAKTYRKNNPTDDAKYEKLLNSIVSTYRGTEAAEEAAKLLDNKVADAAPPVRSTSLEWFAGWQIENLEKRSSVQMYKEFHGEKFVLETVPPDANQALRLKYKVSVPQDKPILELVVGAHEKGLFNLEVELDGKKSGMKSVQGADWKVFDLDLSANKGQEIVLTICHSAPEAKNDAAYWQAPQFVAKADTDAEILSFGDVSGAAAGGELPGKSAWRNAVDLMPLIDPLRDSVAGAWKRQDATLVSEKAFYSRIEIPYQPPQEYDLRIRFTRTAGNDCISEILSCAGHSFSWTMGGSNNRVFGFEMVAGISAVANPTTVSKPNCLENGKIYESIVQVRETGLKAWLDGQLISEWKTDYHDMAIYPEWKLRDGALLGLGCWDSATVFHKIQLLEVKGKGKTASAKPVAAVGSGGGSIKAEYETALIEFYSALATKGLKTALQRVAQAKANPALAPMLSKLEMDEECIGYVQGLHDGVIAGAAKLTDGRAFTLVKNDGKQIVLGEGSKGVIKRVGNEVISIEQNLGGGTASTDIHFNELSAQTQFDLALLGMPGPEANLKLALVKMTSLINSTSRDVLVKEIQGHLDAARKDAALVKKAEHVAGHLEFLNRDFNAQEQYKKIVGLCKAADWRAARTQIEDYKTEYANSNALARVQADLDQWTAKINQELMSPLLKR